MRSIDDLQREIELLAIQITRTRFIGIATSSGWQPAINAFRCDSHFIVCVELAGVDRSAIDLQVESRRLSLRGTRNVPEPACDETPANHVLAMEIDHGRFERVLDLPAEVLPEGVTAEHRNGLLWIKLPLRPHA
jgi:HSP20 family protein